MSDKAASSMGSLQAAFSALANSDMMSGYDRNFFNANISLIQRHKYAPSATLVSRAWNSYCGDYEQRGFGVENLRNMCFDYFSALPVIIKAKHLIDDTIWENTLQLIADKLAPYMLAKHAEHGSITPRIFADHFYKWVDLTPDFSDPLGNMSSGDMDTSLGDENVLFTRDSNIPMDMHVRTTPVLEAEKILRRHISHYGVGVFYEFAKDMDLQSAREILQKGPWLRSDADLARLVSTVTPGLPLFLSVAPADRAGPCRYLTLQEVQPLTVIHRTGFTGALYYVVLAGDALVYKAPEREREEKAPGEESEQDSLSQLIESCGPTGISEKDEVLIARLGQHNAWGSLAFTTPGYASEVRVVAGKIGCTLAVLDQVGFDASFKVLHETASKEKLQFLKQVPLLQNTPPKVLAELARLAVPRRFTRGQVVLQQGAAVKEGMFIVKEGHFRVLKEVLLPRAERERTHAQTPRATGSSRPLRRRRPKPTTQTTQTTHTPKFFVTEPACAPPNSSLSHASHASHTSHVEARELKMREPQSARTAAESGAQAQAVSQFLEVNLLGPGSMFGEVGVIRKGKRTASVVSVLNGEVFEISALTWAHKIDHHTKQLLCTQAHSYPTDSLLRQAHFEDAQWEAYKRQIGEQLGQQSSAFELPVFNTGVLGEYKLRVKGRPARAAAEGKS